MTTQALDLILSASYDTRCDGLPENTAPAQWEDNGTPLDIPDLDGVGAPVFIGRNGTLSLLLTVASVDATPTVPGTLTVTIETAASQQAPAWRPLGAFPAQTAAGSTSLALTGADAFVRARYTLTSGAAFSFSVSGDAQLVLAASASQVASGSSAVVDVAQYRSAVMSLDVSAIAGTLTVTIQTAASRTAPPSAWLTVATFPAVSALASLELPVPDLARFVLVTWTLTGTATFAVAGVSRLTLATPSDRARLGIRAGVFPDLSREDADAWLVSATATVLGAVGGRFEHPPRAWQDDIREATIAIADWRALGYGQGTEPGKNIDAKSLTVYERYTYYVGAADKPGSGWLARVAARTDHPLGFLDSSMPARDGKTRSLSVSSTPLRGWGGPQSRARVDR